jgi:signal transduction histidine kinase
MVQERTPDYLAIADAVTQNGDWKEALDSLIAVLRSIFLFDNLALYLKQPDNRLDEIVYARAIGRGRSAEADAAWGEAIATEVMAKNEMLLQEAGGADKPRDRIKRPYLLGLPLRTPEKVVGALVFVRFGGPAYEPDQVQRAQFIATQVSALFERKMLKEEIAALQDARRQMQLQDDFIATISHELRTPLGFIKGYSTTLLRSDTQWDEATRREFLAIIDEEADRLSMLIENVLESARLQSHTLPMRFQPVRLEAIVHDIILRNQARYKDLQINPVLQKCVPVDGDAVRLAQVLDNLVINAVKYAPGSPITIRLSQEGLWQEISVTDQGPGISPDHTPFLFERFYRIPGQSGVGSGLGLFICRQIIQAHHGELTVASTPGAGTTFYIKLPVEHHTQEESQ